MFLLLLLLQSPPSIDDLIAKVEASRKAKAEAVAVEKAAVEALREAVKVLNSRLVALGLDLPTPPDPKPPAPPEPSPSDPLAVALKASYAADTGTTKANQLADLAELYKQAADLAQDHGVLTTGQLMDRIRQAATALKIDGLLAARKLIAAECAATLGTDPDANLSGDLRTKAQRLFLRVHDALKKAGE